MSDFTFIDLFAGIGGLRRAFESQGGKCVWSSEWDEYAVSTYSANFPNGHKVWGDITTAKPEMDIPRHDVLLAGFPCQPFSLAGVSKKNSLGRPHGFLDETQGTLFFDVARIIHARKPKAFLLENVKNLRSHDSGKTFATIKKVLKEELKYHVFEAVINANSWVPQNRQRIFIVGFKLDVPFSWSSLDIPTERPTLALILHSPDEEPEEPYTVADLLEFLPTGRLLMEPSCQNGQELQSILTALSSAAKSSGDLCWNDYAKELGVELLPAGNDQSKTHFVRTLIDSMTTFIAAAQTSGHAKRIFDLRIISQPRDRKTLFQAAEILGCSGPQIKREEAILLRRLQSAVFEENYLAARARFQTAFIGYWKEAQEVRSKNPNQSDYLEALSSEWKISRVDLLEIVPALVSVIDGRPRGYPGIDAFSDEDDVMLEEPSNAVAEKSIEPIVKLRGFRIVH